MNDEAYAAELFREDGEHFRSVRMSVETDGAVRLDTQDMGPTVQEFWGDSDYEFWVTVPAAALPKLAFALLREKYAGRRGAVDDFRAFCEREGVDHQWSSWA